MVSGAKKATHEKWVTNDKTNSVYVSDIRHDRHDIYFSNLKLVRKNGSASVVDTPNISEKSINNFNNKMLTF